MLDIRLGMHAGTIRITRDDRADERVNERRQRHRIVPSGTDTFHNFENGLLGATGGLGRAEASCSWYNS